LNFKLFTQTLIVVGFTFLAVSGVSVAQEENIPPIEVGVKVPLSGFMSVEVNDKLRLEASAVLPGFSAPLVDFEALLTAKFYPFGTISLQDIPTNIFIGGGGLFISSLGNFIPGFVGTIGADFIPPGDLPLIAFLEFSAAMPMTEGSTSIVFSLSVGGRYSLKK
jgi:hypothetical protein